MKLIKALSIVLVIIFLPAICLAAADGGHHGFPWTHAINFTVFFVGGYFLLKKPLGNKWAARCQALEEDVMKAQREREKAEKILQDAQALLATAEDESKKIKAGIKQETEHEIVKIKEDAVAQAERIIKQAETNAESELKSCEQAVQAEFAEKVCEKAKEKLETEFTPEFDQEYRAAGLDGMKTLLNQA